MAPQPPEPGGASSKGSTSSRGQQTPDLRALHALAAPVDEPRLAQAEPAALVEIVGDHVQHVPRRERVQVQLAGHGQDERLVRVLVLHPQPPKRAAAAA